MSDDRGDPPLGERESATVAFAEGATLRDALGRKSLLRVVTALRNGDAPGTLWIGVRTRDGAAFAFDPLRPEDRPLLDALRDVALDALEPQPTFALLPNDSRRAECKALPIARGDGFVVRIDVEPVAAGHPPAAVAFGSAVEFLRREGTRVVAIPYADLFRPRIRAARSANASRPEVALVASHRAWCDGFSDVGGLAIGVLRAPALPRRGASRLAGWRDLLRSPPAALARPGGWSWFDARGAERVEDASVERGTRGAGTAYRVLRFETRGAVRFFTDLRSLRSLPQASPDVARLEPRTKGQLGQLCVFESVVSTLRLARRLLLEDDGDASDPTLYAVVSFVRAKDYALPLYAPGTLGSLAVDRSDLFMIGADEAASAVLRRPGASLAADVDADRFAAALLRSVFATDGFARDLSPGDLPWFAADGAFAPPG